MNRSASIPALLGLLAGSAGCALQFGAGGGMTLLGPAHVYEFRTIDAGQKRAARIVKIQSVGLAPAFASHRTGLAAGYVRDVMIDVYAFESLSEELRAWAVDRSPGGRFVLFYQSVPAPGVHEIARVRGFTTVGAGVNALERQASLSAGFASSQWISGDADAPPFALALSDDASTLVFLKALPEP